MTCVWPALKEGGTAIALSLPSHQGCLLAFGKRWKAKCPVKPLGTSNRPPNSCTQECSGRICSLFLLHVLGSGPLVQDSCQSGLSPALNEHARGGWLHNSFPIICTLPGLLEAPAAKCKQVSPLTATPAAQPAVTQPAASLATLHLPAPCASSHPFSSGWGQDLSFPSAGSLSPHLPQRRVPVPLCWVPGLSMQSHVCRHLPAAQGEST